MDNEIINTCIHCKKPIEAGRKDKKFCDHYCRNAYNNQYIRDSEKVIKTINQILRKNRSILKTINPQGLTSIRKEYLLFSGFNFKYFTHKYEAQNGNVYWFCYEYGYCYMPDPEKIMIVNRQDYMDKKLE